MSDPHVPIVYGPSTYAALNDLALRLGVRISSSRTSPHGVPTVRVDDVRDVELIADDLDVGVVQVGGRHSCVVELAGRLIRFEALAGHGTAHHLTGRLVRVTPVATSLVLVDDWLDRMPTWSPTALATEWALEALAHENGDDQIVYGHLGRLPLLFHDSEIDVP